MRSWMWAWGCREPAEGSTEGAPETAIYTALPAQPDADGDGSPDLADCERASDDGLVTIVGGGTYTDLALALQEAQPGDELLVCPGFYTGVFSADGVTLTGLQGRQVTTLSSSFYDTSVLQTTGDVRVQGLTLRFGQAEEGGGIRHQGPGQLTLVDSRVQENLAERGGGIAVIGGSLSLIDSDVWDNEATSGGGLYAVDAVLDLGTSTVSSNLASGSGGGVWMRDSELVGGRLESNLAVTSLYVYSYTGYPLSEARGGGLAASGTCTVSGVEIVQNSAREGAGVYTSGEDLDCRLTLQDTEIRDNGDELLSSGGGVWARYCALSLQGTTEIVSNRAGVGGGGGLATGGVTDLQHVELSDNVATSGRESSRSQTVSCCATWPAPAGAEPTSRRGCSPRSRATGARESMTTVQMT
jgi:hypothetical protein